MTSSTPNGPADPATVELIPLLEERLQVDVRPVDGGAARVHISVAERDQTIEAMLRRQDVAVERVAIDRQVAEAPPVRQEGDTLIVPVLEERLVVETRLFLKEELRIRIAETRVPVSQTVRLRREHAEIETFERNKP